MSYKVAENILKIRWDAKYQKFKVTYFDNEENTLKNAYLNPITIALFLHSYRQDVKIFRDEKEIEEKDGTKRIIAFWNIGWITP